MIVIAMISHAIVETCWETVARLTTIGGTQLKSCNPDSILCDPVRGSAPSARKVQPQNRGHLYERPLQVWPPFTKLESENSEQL